MDGDNPVIKLCIEGQKAESQGKKDDALKYYLKAWKIRSNNLESCISAHFVARQHPDVKKVLSWNLLALEFANKVKNNLTEDFYPSLYINIADAYEKLGEIDRAKHYYDLAESTVTETSLGSYGVLLSESIKKGQQRTTSNK